MAYKNLKEGGIRTPSDMRVGVGGFPPFEGVNKSLDPSAIRETQFAHLENVRRTRKGILIERGGQQKTHDSAIDTVEGFYDASDIGAPVARTAGPGIYSPDNHIFRFHPSVGLLDYDIVPAERSPAAVVLKRNTRDTLHVFAVGTRVAPPPNTSFVYWDEVTSGAPPTYKDTGHTTAITPASLESPSGVVRVGSVVYVGIRSTTGGVGARVLRWDTAAKWNSLTNPAVSDQPGLHSRPTLYLAASPDGTQVIAFYNSGVVGSNAIAGNIAVRLRNAAGTWGDVAPALAVGDLGLVVTSAAVYRGVLYIGGYVQVDTYVHPVDGIVGVTDAVIYTWNGTNLAEVHRIQHPFPPGTPPGPDKFYAIDSLAVHDDKLVYGWGDARGTVSAPAVAAVGTYDGSTWTNTAKDLAAQFPGDDLTSTGQLIDMDGVLYAQGRAHATTVGLYHSPTIPAAISGAWAQDHTTPFIAGDNVVLV